MKRSNLPFLLAVALLLPTIHLFAPATFGQQRDDLSKGPPDLALQNMDRVAASASEIRSVLSSDPGLMVELKRWVAKDATDHSQIVSDPDLTDSAIFERLDSDLRFRSVATALVQRYGYLLPKLNPDSELAKQRALVMQERAKWLARDQEEENLTRGHQATRSFENAVPCDQQNDGGCRVSQNRSLSSGEWGQAPQPSAPPSRALPEGQNPIGVPGESPTMHAQTNPEGQDFTGSATPPLPLPGFYPSGSSPDFVNVNASESGGHQTALGDPSSSSSPTSGTYSSTFSSGTDGLLAAYDDGINVGRPSTSEAGNSTSVDGTNPSLSLARRPEMAPLPQPQVMNRKESPYKDIPSLYDMYVQASARPAAPRRFGTEVFNNRTRDSQLIPMDLPVGPDYVVGPGDGLAINLWGGVSRRMYLTVDREGRVNLPEVGPLLVTGKSLAAVQQNLQQSLRTQFRDVSADVSLSRLRTIRVYVVGDLANPGAYDISSLSTPLNALFVAGGPSPRGSLRILKHYRGTQLIQTVDLYDLLIHGVKTDLQRLENGDTIQVPPIGPQVTVEGMVRRPAIYEIRDEKNLATVLELGGGLLPTAALRHIEVQRLIAHDRQTMLSLDIPNAGDISEVTKKLESFDIRDGDRIRIYPIAPYNEDTVYLEGHVVRPGRYSYHTDMRVTDVISSYKDMLPEPATQHAEIIRLNPPDFHPSVEGFDLADALANPADSPVLRPMDTVRIFSRFDFEDPPIVSIGGEVRRPGTYQTSGEVHLSDAIHVAGGLTPDAETGDAQVMRQLPDGKLRIFSINLSKALAGDPVENILLQTRDQLLIHRNPDQVELATVTVQGEIARPGRYPLSMSMHVADLIRLGGGLTPSADTELADLTKFQWDNMGLKGQQESISIAAAIAGDSKSNASLHNGDVLTIRQLPGWNDLGASITVGGEVVHPGTYGIRPGEHLSSVLARAGGLLPTAYPKGVVFQRQEVRQLEQKSRDDLIQHILQEPPAVSSSLQDNGQDRASLLEAAVQQRNNAIAALQQAPVMGRMVVRIPSDLAHLRGSPDDIEVRRGDELFIPKEPQFVVITGQVYNPNAIAFRPRHDVSWYLRQAGGATQQANRKSIFLIRADGSVVSNQGSALWNGGVLSTNVEPGDTIMVPEKAVVGSGAAWRNLIPVAQLASAAALTAYVVAH